MSLSDVSPTPSWNAPAALLRLSICLAICFAAAGIGSWLTVPNIPGWYASLVKPPFNPPNWLFGPVWSALYLLMAISLWRIWQRGHGAAQRATFTAFGVQIVLNVLWSGAFFGLHQPLLALVVIIALLAAIVATIVTSARIDRLASWLYAPYLVWVSFAAVLNASIWLLN